MDGIFITFEGLDGAGKTTQVSLLHSYLSSLGKSVFLTREPGGTGVGERIRDMLKGSFMEPITELLLFYASRAEHAKKIVKPMLARGDIVICDRFVDSSIAYQVFGRGVDEKIIENLNEMTIGELKPDLTILLKIPSHAAQRRAQMRFEVDRWDGESNSFSNKVANGYKELVKREPERFLVVDGTMKKEKVAENIRREIDKLLEAKK